MIAQHVSFTVAANDIATQTGRKAHVAASNPGNSTGIYVITIDDPIDEKNALTFCSVPGSDDANVAKNYSWQIIHNSDTQKTLYVSDLNNANAAADPSGTIVVAFFDRTKVGGRRHVHHGG